MSAIAHIIDTMRGRRKQAAIDHATSYTTLVRDVALGNEIDADNAADILELHNKTEEEFAKDCETQARRFAIDEEVKRLTKLELTLPTLRKELDRAQAALQAAHDKLQPAVAEAAQRLREAETLVLPIDSLKSQLRRTSLDSSILIREAELNEQRKSIGSKLKPIEDDLNRARGAEQNLVSNRERLQRSFGELSQRDLPNRSEYRTKLEAVEQQLKSVRSRIQDLQNLRDEIKAQLQPIDRELAQLDAKKLEA